MKKRSRILLFHLVLTNSSLGKYIFAWGMECVGVGGRGRKARETARDGRGEKNVRKWRIGQKPMWGKHQGLIKWIIMKAIKQDWERKKERAWGFYQVFEIITTLGTERQGEESNMHTPDWTEGSCSLAEKGWGWGGGLLSRRRRVW